MIWDLPWGLACLQGRTPEHLEDFFEVYYNENKRLIYISAMLEFFTWWILFLTLHTNVQICPEYNFPITHFYASWKFIKQILICGSSSLTQILILETEIEGGKKKKKSAPWLSCPLSTIKVLVYLSISEFEIFSFLTLNEVLQKQNSMEGNSQAFLDWKVKSQST